MKNKLRNQYSLVDKLNNSQTLYNYTVYIYTVYTVYKYKLKVQVHECVQYVYLITPGNKVLRSSTRYSICVVKPIQHAISLGYGWLHEWVSALPRAKHSRPSPNRPVPICMEKFLVTAYWLPPTGPLNT